MIMIARASKYIDDTNCKTAIQADDDSDTGVELRFSLISIAVTQWLLA